jgi:signal transduction histidine kinase
MARVPIRTKLLKLLQHRPVPLAGRFAVLLALLEVFFDYGTWVDLNVSIVYSLPLVLAAAARNRRLLWGLTLALLGATFAVYFIQIEPGHFLFAEPRFINRVLAALTIVLTAVLLDVWTHVLDMLDAQSRLLAEQNEGLESVNLALVHHKEEILRQNELLERRRHEAEEASGRKTRLLASASHDIRTPVNAINLMAEVIRRYAESPLLVGQVPGMAQRLQANAASLSGLLAEVLDISSFDSGRVEIRENEFSLNELLAEACNRALPKVEGKPLRLIPELPEPPLWLRTDKVKLTRIVNNLLSNAIKFTEQGSVTITAERKPQHGALIRIRDTGLGIAPENLKDIFAEFVQVHGSARGAEQGWGLGLAICQRLIKLIGGSIAAESALGRGTVFTVSLPASSVVDGRRDSEGQTDGA